MNFDNTYLFSHVLFEHGDVVDWGETLKTINSISSPSCIIVTDLILPYLPPSVSWVTPNILFPDRVRMAFLKTPPEFRFPFIRHDPPQPFSIFLDMSLSLPFLAKEKDRHLRRCPTQLVVEQIEQIFIWSFNY